MSIASVFEFDGHDYHVTDRAGIWHEEFTLLDSAGEFVCSASEDITGEYWIVTGSDGATESHYKDCDVLDVVKAYISGTY